MKKGFSIVEAMISLAILVIIASIAVPQILAGVNRSNQRRVMADMRNIATANDTYRLEYGRYAERLQDLEGGFMNPVPLRDAWENLFEYQVFGGSPPPNRQGFRLVSFGSDGSEGPEPPLPWRLDDSHFTPDIVWMSKAISRGVFTQAPLR